MSEQALLKHFKDRIPPSLREKEESDLGQWLTQGALLERPVEFDDGRGGKWRLAPEALHGRIGLLCLAHSPDGEEWGRSYYTGLSAGYGKRGQLLMFNLKGQAEGDRIRVNYSAETVDFREVPRQGVINVHAIKKDTDDDGLPDLEEELLFTDPDNADTDGDGVPDGADMCPLAGAPEESNDVHAICRAAIARILGNSRADFLVISVPDEAAKQDFGLSGTRLLVFTDSELNTLWEAGDLPVLRRAVRLSEVFIDSAAGEARVTVSGGCGSGVILRKIEGTWRIVEVRILWIS